MVPRLSGNGGFGGLVVSLVQRKIDVTIALGPLSNPNGTDNFGPGTGNTKTLSGLRVSAQIDLTGGPGMSQATVRIYGMTQSDMTKLSTLGKPLLYFRDNGITLSAGDDVAGMASVFTGGFYAAYQDFAAAPDNAFVITAHAGLLGAMQPVAPVSYKGSADVAVILSGLASQMGLKFENSGVQGVTLQNPYLPGTARDQAQRVADAANINLYFDGDPPNGTMAIWPRTGVRGGMVPDIGKTNDLVGYPTFADSGCVIKCLFNRNVQPGGQFNLTTSLTSAQGLWNVRYLRHEIEAMEPGGSWFTVIDALRPGTQPQ